MTAKKNLLFVLLRFAIGWHFLYEGITKLFISDWSAETYLKGSYGFLSPLFHSLAENENVLNIVNFLNIWGLVFIGLGLMLGIFIRLSAVSGMLLLMLYYFAYPPFGDYLLNTSNGNFWIIDRNLVEVLALLILLFYPVKDYSLWNIIKRKSSEEHSSDPGAEISGRRKFLRGMITLPFAGGVIYSAAASAGERALDGNTGATLKLSNYDLGDLKGSLPKGKIGELEISRIILGCNLISGYSHSRDLHYVSSLFRHYNTEAKIYETYSLAEKAGIDTVNVVLSSFPFFNRYKKVTGSTLKTIAQVHVKPDAEDPLLHFKQARDMGTTSMYVQGGCADQLVKNKQADYIEQAVEFVRQQGMQAGVGAHSIQVVLECMKRGLKPDYYFKTVHHDNYWSAHPREFRKEFEVDKQRFLDHNRFHDNIFDIFPEQTIEVFQNIDVPLVGFKVLAGGAIKPEDGYRYAFEAGSDFICVGMFDFQIIENVNLVSSILEGNLNRNRKWYS